ncbi:MAG: phosphate acyltransferase PlsX [Candidatus Omnitrophica bacterium]|nr:phosphate acyltransferase PlsX [Candidatus Omnitrophota bacterium]
MEQVSNPINKKRRIAVDAMGGDFAPQATVEGAYFASLGLSEVEIILVGKKDLIEREIEKTCPGFMPRIVDASEEIKMDESPALSVRRKKKSSIVLGVNLLKDKEADALVSCGNTGALVCASTVYLGLIQQVERPGIGLVVPTLKGPSFMIDVGANIDPKPIHLMQYALMAEVYSKKVLDKKSPSIGLLNIGEEETKGPEFLRETALLLRESCPGFIGNIEPKDIFLGKCDCIVSDGLAGNIALKVTEGFAEAVGHFMASEVKKDILGLIGFLLLKRSLKRFSKIMDYSEYGGAPLLGVNGVVIIGHGRSNAKAVKNAIRVAVRELERDVNHQIQERINV